MSQRLKSLYTYLVESRRGALDGWLTEYQKFTGEVAKIRTALQQGNPLESETTYQNTVFASAKPSPWREFASQLLRAQNGVTTRGQSVLSHNNFDFFLEEAEFKQALSSLIAEPSLENFVTFEKVWEELCKTRNAGRNPLLVNRTLAACTLDVSSTVNVSSFEYVYQWLTIEGLISPSGATSWAEKNVEVIKFLRDTFKSEIDSGSINEHLLSMFVWELHEFITNPFSLKKQIVKYGAPGTGKTYSAKRETRLLFDIWCDEFQSTHFTYETCSQTVQFHPSYGYEDFMEGLRPILDTTGKAQLTLQNGIFKHLCIKAGQWEREVFNIPLEGPKLAKDWITKTISDLTPYKKHLNPEHWQYIFDHHDHTKKIADTIPPFFLIIDEINRAELSRVLGELMFCLEYRGVEGAISTQYAKLNTADTGMLAVGGDYKFFVPHNVFIVGTMNTIDRSVDSFDLALRRRFYWEKMGPDLTTLKYHLKNKSRAWVPITDNLENLNKAITAHELLGEDYQIGQAYLMNLGYPSHLSLSDLRANIWEDSIQPLLEEYLRGSGRSNDILNDFKKAFSVQ